MSGQDEKPQHLIVEKEGNLCCPNCNGRDWYRFYTQYGTASLTTEPVPWDGADYDSYELSWGQEGWKCSDCEEYAPEHLQEWLDGHC